MPEGEPAGGGGGALSALETEKSVSVGKREGRKEEKKETHLSSRCSCVSTNVTEILLPASFRPCTIRPRSCSTTSSAPAGVFSLTFVLQKQLEDVPKKRTEGKNGFNQYDEEAAEEKGQTHRTKVIRVQRVAQSQWLGNLGCS